MGKNLRSFYLLVMAILIVLSASPNTISVKAANSIKAAVSPSPLVIGPQQSAIVYYGTWDPKWVAWMLDMEFTNPARWKNPRKFVGILHYATGSGPVPYYGDIRYQEYAVICKIRGQIQPPKNHGDLIYLDGNSFFECLWPDMSIPGLDDISISLGLDFSYMDWGIVYNKDGWFTFKVEVEATGKGNVIETPSLSLSQHNTVNNQVSYNVIFYDDRGATPSLTIPSYLEYLSTEHTAQVPSAPTLTFVVSPRKIVFNGENFTRPGQNLAWYMPENIFYIGRGFTGDFGNLKVDPCGATGSGGKRVYR